MKNGTVDLSRPEVHVRIPQVNLRLEDLSFLRSLAQPNSVRCHVGYNSMQRLRFLDLIARAKVPRTEERRQELLAEIAKSKTELTKAIAKEDWNSVGSAARTLEHLKQQLQPAEDDVLTERGKALLSTGEITVKVRKVGCAK